jgi:hypothetical protein
MRRLAYCFFTFLADELSMALNISALSCTQDAAAHDWAISINKLQRELHDELAAVLELRGSHP